MELLIFGLVLGAIILIVWGLLFSQPSTLLRMPKDGSEIPFQKPQYDFAKLFPTQSFLQKSGMTGNMKKMLDAAHINISPGAYFNLKVVGCILLSVFVIAFMGKVEPLVLLCVFAVGYIIPDIIVKRKVARRKYLIARRLPETVDLLGLCIEAGLDFVNAVKWVIERTPHTLMTEELALVVEEIKWGKPRIQALKDMAHRLEIPEMSSFVQTIIQAERMGTPVAEAFTILSEDARSQRFHRGERIALQAPIKILVPLIFCIMPVIGIIVGGPILLQFMQGGLTGMAGK